MMSLVQVQIQKPATQSVFPSVDELLEDSDYQKALEFIGHRKDMRRYRSVVDFLFAELIGGKWKASCFRFYEGNGPKLIDDSRVTPEMLSEWEIGLVKSLGLAYDLWELELECSWKTFRKQWKRVA